jgi:hypothetical protein
MNTDVTENDRLWAALAWVPVTPLWPLVAIAVLFLGETKERPYIRYHAFVSLVSGLILIPVTALTLGLGGVLYLVFFYYAYLAYQNRPVEVPFVSGFVRQQGWAK